MNFIQESFLKNIDICDQIIKYYKKSNKKKKGGMVYGLNEKIKKCTEICISDFEIEPFKEYFSLLQEKDYIKASWKVKTFCVTIFKIKVSKSCNLLEKML